MATLQNALLPSILKKLQSDILEEIQEHGSRLLIVDLSGMLMMEPEELEGILKITDMADLMGVKTVFAGIRPEVAYGLVQMGADTGNIRSALNMDEAYAQLDEMTNKGVWSE